MNIRLDNIEKFSTPYDESIIQRFFTDEDNITPSPEHEDQIIYFTGNAAKFLWNLEMKLGLSTTSKHFNSISTFNTAGKSSAEIKKYLFNLSIPFDHWVFIIEQPDTCFKLTWKMVIKYFSGLFLTDQIIWDNSFNWRLEYYHDGVFTFARGIIHNVNDEGEKLAIAVKEMNNRKY
ncbi:MAG: hypothetical protein QM791_23290 [Ferruginibacter sp.]